MPAFWDFSAALPWVGGGFIAGLLVAWLIRKLTGVDARRLREIQQLKETLEDAKRAHGAIVSANQQLEAERVRLTAQINELSPRAGLVPQFERQVAELRQSLLGAQASLETSNKDLTGLREQMAGELVALRDEAEVKGSTAKYYEEEYGRLHAAHQALNKDATAASALVTKLQNDYVVASRAAQDAVRLRSEIGSLRAQLESTQADLAHVQAAAKSDATAREAEIARCREALTKSK